MFQEASQLTPLIKYYILYMHILYKYIYIIFMYLYDIMYIVSEPAYKPFTVHYPEFHAFDPFPTQIP